MPTQVDRGMIETFVQKSARPIYNYRQGRARADIQYNDAIARGGLTAQKRAEQELHDLIMEYAMNYAVAHNVEVS